MHGHDIARNVAPDMDRTVDAGHICNLVVGADADVMIELEAVAIGCLRQNGRPERDCEGTDEEGREPGHGLSPGNCAANSICPADAGSSSAPGFVRPELERNIPRASGVWISEHSFAHPRSRSH